MMEARTIPSDSSLWEEAALMLEKQPMLANHLTSVFQSKPSSGFYQDEPSNPDEFAAFVQMVRETLVLSPRTVLRSAMNQSFARIQSSAKKNDVQVLCKMLSLNPIHTTTTMHQLSKAVSLVSPGQVHAKWKHAVQDLEQQQATDVSDICAKVQSKLAKTTTREALEQILAKVRDKHHQRTAHLQERVQRLETELANDTEYQQYCRIQELWESTGCRSLWERFLQVDLQLCRSRNEQGGSFESTQQELVFCMIVLTLMTQKRHSEGYALERQDFSFCCNVHWWKDKKAVPVGELDLVILHKHKVVAICEMKTSCFLLSQAFRQHQAKVDSCNLSSSETTSKSLGIGTKPDCLLPLHDEGKTLELFVATCSPDSNQLLGAEPVLSTAIGDGIRAQGLLIANEATKKASAPLVGFMLGASKEMTTSQVIDYLWSTSTPQDGPVRKASSLDDEDDLYLDLDRLFRFVQDRLGATLGGSLSPAGSFRQWKENVFLLSAGMEGC